MSPKANKGSTFGDSSGNLFSFYSEIATEEDDKNVDHWQNDADSILIFTGLFSAAVAALLAVSVQDLSPGSDDKSAFYLANIYQVLANPKNFTVPRTYIPPTFLEPPPFSPPRYAVWVNALWFLSLVISLTCALLATLLQQWARGYIMNTQPKRCRPEKRARMRAFFANGIEKTFIPLPQVVEALPALLHLSLFLFFSGLLIFLFNVNQTVFIPVASWIALFSVAYCCITVMPIYRRDSPYYAPLSSIAWSLYVRIQYAIFAVLAFIASQTCCYSSALHFGDLRDRYRSWWPGGIGKAIEEAISKPSSDIDLRILEWTVDALGGDDSLENFFKFIPDFSRSKLVRNVQRNFSSDLAKRFWEALCGFLDRTLSSNSLPERVRNRRLRICGDVLKAIPGPTVVSNLLDDALKKHLNRVSLSIETGQTLAHWFNNTDQYISQYARNRVVGILVGVQNRDDRWKTLAANQFGLSEDALQDNINLPHDSVLLYLLNHVVGQALDTGSFSASILSSLSNFTIAGTDPGLQHEFCQLWNRNIDSVTAQGVQVADVAIDILRHVRRLFLALHRGPTALPIGFDDNTDDDDPVLLQPMSYSRCTLPGHSVPAMHPHHPHPA